MKIDKVIIMGMPFSVEYKSDGARDDGRMGNVDSKRGTIILSSSIPEDFQKLPLLHEVFHCLSDRLGLELSEQQVLSLSSGLFRFFKENPKFKI